MGLRWEELPGELLWALQRRLARCDGSQGPLLGPREVSTLLVGLARLHTPWPALAPSHKALLNSLAGPG